MEEQRARSHDSVGNDVGILLLGERQIVNEKVNRRCPFVYFAFSRGQLVNPSSENRLRVEMLKLFNGTKIIESMEFSLRENGFKIHTLPSSGC